MGATCIIFWSPCQPPKKMAGRQMNVEAMRAVFCEGSQHHVGVSKNRGKTPKMDGL